jgi:hypothetical protein
MYMPLKMRSRSPEPLPPARAPAIHLGAPGARQPGPSRNSAPRALPPPPATSEDVDGKSDCMLFPRSTRHGARKAGAPPLLDSHAPSSAAAEEISTVGSLQRLLLGLRAPVPITTTLANTERAVRRRAADDSTMLVVVPAGSVVWHP